MSTKLRSQETRSKHHAKLATLEAEQDPRSYAEAMSRSDGASWWHAMKEEIQSLEKNQEWDLVDRPSGNIVTNKWVFKIKRRPNGESNATKLV